MKHLYNPQGTKKNFTFIKSAALLVAAVVTGFSLFAQSNASANVSLISFNADLQSNSSVNLAWTLPQDNQASHFVIQRSTDGNEFDDKAIVFTGEENSQAFDYADNISKLPSGVLYYRLKMVDAKGAYTYSMVEQVRSATRDTSVLESESPTLSQLRVVLPINWQNKKVQFKVYNAAGLLIKEQENSHATEVQALSISNLKTGIYTVEASNGKEVVTQKVLKILSSTL